MNIALGARRSETDATINLLGEADEDVSASVAPAANVEGGVDKRGVGTGNTRRRNNLPAGNIAHTTIRLSGQEDGGGVGGSVGVEDVLADATRTGMTMGR